MKAITSKKAENPILDALPTWVWIMLATVVILIIVYAMYKGGLGFISNPPIKKLPI